MYRSLVRSLIYLTTTRSDIIHDVSVVSRYIDKLSKTHLMATMKILRYVKEIKNFGVNYVVENNVKLIRYLYSD